MVVPVLRPMLVAMLLGGLLLLLPVAPATAAPAAGTTAGGSASVGPPYASAGSEPNLEGCAADLLTPLLRACAPYAAAEPGLGVLSAGYVDTGNQCYHCWWDTRRGVTAARAWVAAVLPRNGRVVVELEVLEAYQQAWWLNDSALWVAVEQGGKTLATVELCCGRGETGSWEPLIAIPLTIQARGASAGEIRVALIARRYLSAGPVAGTLRVRSITVG